VSKSIPNLLYPRLFPQITGTLKGALSLIYPVECPWCKKIDSEACLECLSQWSGAPVVRGIFNTPIYSPIYYDGLSAEIILRAKENRERAARRFVTTAISSVLNRFYFPEGVILVPIPASRQSIRRRGEDFIERVARESIELTKVNAKVLKVLYHNRRVMDQSKLTSREREENLSGSLSVERSALNKLSASKTPLVIVDDVITTGATLRAAISAIADSPLGIGRVVAGITAASSR
jgi:predicted amidophosphoribosyltransferase